MNRIRTCILLVLICPVYANAAISSVVTKIGLINGVNEKINVFGRNFQLNKYLGIPYAQAPIGELRFKKPVAKLPLQEALDATKYGNACLQPDIGIQPHGNITYSEDCLFLNIYAPSTSEEQENLAVMIWFHGGGFVAGSGDIYPGEHLASYGNVVVVTVNYRLSLWGFLSTKDANSPGNYGLWDQHLAMRWVHENIAAFGGDNTRVTIFGESAGGAAAVFHGLYPGNKGLFQRMIAQSGTAGSWWPTSDESLEDTQKLAKLAGCDTSSTQQIMDCLKTLSGKDLHDILDNNNNGFKRVPIPFIPTVDDEFITLSGRDTFQKGIKLPKLAAEFYLSLDLIAGMTSGEGSLSVSPLFGVADPENFFSDKHTFETKLVPILQNMMYAGNKHQLIKDMIIEEYTNLKTPDDHLAIREEFLAMHSDSIFAEPLYRTLDHHTNTTKANYMYYFDEFSINHMYCHLSWLDKMAHGDEIPYVFGYKHADHIEEWKFIPTSWEEELSKSVIKLWTNFAKTGNPNLPDDLGLDWLPYTKEHQHYLQISRAMTSSNVKQRLNIKRVYFWGNILPQVVKALQSNSNYDTCNRKSGKENDTCNRNSGKECLP